MRLFPLVLLSIAAAVRFAVAATVEPEVAELTFDRRFEKSDALAEAHQPAWITNVEQQGGQFLDDPRGWQVAASAPEGIGRLMIAVDRQRLNSDLVATILFDADDAADIAVQLFDAQGRVVIVDLFGNLVDVGKELTTDTFIIPLRKYPTAEKIVIRRIQGAVNVRGTVLFPVAMQGEPVNEELEKLARVLGDPLSPENPLLKSLQNVARSAKVTIDPALAAAFRPATTVALKSAGGAPAKPTTAAGVPASHTPSATKPERGVYQAAVAPAAVAATTSLPSSGLVAYWNFDHGDDADAGPHKLNGRIRGAAQFVDGIRGKAIRLHGAGHEAVGVRHAAALDLKDTLTVAAWIKYSSIAPTWGSQIVWYGDEQLGRDPWSLQLLTDGTLCLRSDRSVTGKPVFTVFDNEIKLSGKGEEELNQHVEVDSPKTLAPETWYFVAGTIEKISPRLRSLKLYVNGEMVGEVKTEEAVTYDTSRMWMEIGGVDFGNWQNFDGAIDEVRVYNRPLAPSEIQALYLQPRQ
jgi:concanavalin A-like lectin/glucanase superfamily protein